MSLCFTGRDLKIFLEVAEEIEEVLVDLRKGVPQTRYIVHVPKDATWSDWDKLTGAKSDVKHLDQPVPTSLSGYWQMEYASDLRYTTCKVALEEYPWEKCKQKEVITHEWVKRE